MRTLPSLPLSTTARKALRLGQKSQKAEVRSQKTEVRIVPPGLRASHADSWLLSSIHIEALPSGGDYILDKMRGLGYKKNGCLP
jgi:hypothetical protein